MNYRKVILPALALTLAAGVGVSSLKSVYAEENTKNFPPMIQGLIERFNLDETEVSSYLEEERGNRQAEMQAKSEERLNDLVADGTITEDQKAAIQAKREEMRANMGNRENMQDLSEEERESQREAHKATMEAWAQENGIDLELIHMGGEGGPRQGGEGKGMGRGR